MVWWPAQQQQQQLFCRKFCEGVFVWVSVPFREWQKTFFRGLLLDLLFEKVHIFPRKDNVFLLGRIFQPGKSSQFFTHWFMYSKVPPTIPGKSHTKRFYHSFSRAPSSFSFVCIATKVAKILDAFPPRFSNIFHQTIISPDSSPLCPPIPTQLVTNWRQFHPKFRPKIPNHKISAAL